MTKIFVFGSNLAGRHGKGAALFARQHYGAEYGVGEGRTGNAYAIPTKDGSLNVLPLRRIKKGVKGFLRYAKAHPELSFQLTPIGCGLAGYAYSDIGPLFAGAPSNVRIPQEFKRFMGVEKSACKLKRVRLST